MKGDDIALRLLNFAALVLELADLVPTRRGGSHVATQLLRAGTAGGALYAEARCAQSANDFVHKTMLAAKEMSEANYWLCVVQRTRLISERAASYEPVISKAIRESRELAAILLASAHTARTNAG